MKTLYHLKVDHNQSVPLEVQGKVCTLSPQRGFDSLYLINMRVIMLNQQSSKKQDSCSLIQNFKNCEYALTPSVILSSKQGGFCLFVFCLFFKESAFQDPLNLSYHSTNCYVPVMQQLNLLSPTNSTRYVGICEISLWLQ